jgi:hypothetical protein
MKIVATRVFSAMPLAIALCLIQTAVFHPASAHVQRRWQVDPAAALVLVNNNLLNW